MDLYLASLTLIVIAASEGAKMSDQAGLRAAIGIMTVDEVALLLDVTTHTLAIWRGEKKGPAYARLGRSIFYRRTDVEEWIANNVVAPDTQAA